MQDQQKKAQISRQGGVQNQHPSSVQGRPMQVAVSSPQSAPLQRGPQGPLAMNGASQFPHAYPPHTPHPRPSSANLGLAPSEQSTPHNVSAVPDALLDLPQANGFGDGNVLDQELQGLKRKMDFDTEDSKRARQKTGQCHYRYIRLPLSSVFQSQRPLELLYVYDQFTYSGDLSLTFSF